MQILDLLIVYIVIVNVNTVNQYHHFIVFIIYLSLPRNRWWWKSWGITWELQTKKKVFYFLLEVYIYYLESFLTVKFCPAWEVVILGGTENWKIFNQSKNQTKVETKSWQIYLQCPFIDGKILLVSISQFYCVSEIGSNESFILIRAL